MEPFKVWSPAYPVEGSKPELSACQYGSVQSERVSSGDFKVVLPSLPPNIQLDSVGFGFNFEADAMETEGMVVTNVIEGGPASSVLEVGD